MEKSIQLPVPVLENLFHAEFEIGEIYPAGDSPEGKLNIITYPSGKFKGPKMQGTIIPCGGNWNIIRPDGVSCIDGKYMLRTDDGTVLPIDAKGASVSPPVYELLEPGSRFHERLQFKTGAKKYRWLNDVVIVAESVIVINKDETGKSVHLDAWVVR